MIRDLVHKYFNLKTLRCLCVVMFVLFLTACEKDDDSSLGGEGNYAEQANCWQAKIIEIVLSQINNMFSDASGKWQTAEVRLLCSALPFGWLFGC